MLVNEVPLLLHRDLYALPALLGALVVVAGSGHVSDTLAVVLGTVVATGLRCIALGQRRNLPRARSHDT